MAVPGLRHRMTDTEYEGLLWDIGGVVVELKSIREGYAAFVGDLAREHGLDPGAALEAWKYSATTSPGRRAASTARPARATSAPRSRCSRT